MSHSLTPQTLKLNIYPQTIVDGFFANVVGNLRGRLTASVTDENMFVFYFGVLRMRRREPVYRRAHNHMLHSREPSPRAVAFPPATALSSTHPQAPGPGRYPTIAAAAWVRTVLTPGSDLHDHSAATHWNHQEHSAAAPADRGPVHTVNRCVRAHVCARTHTHTHTHTFRVDRP